ncbi:HNH endonuclease [bacterium]|nr:HNH endonuclease [bacterium]
MTLILKKSLHKRLDDTPKPDLAKCDELLRTKAAGKCDLCDGALGSDADCEVDHVVPSEDGGGDELGNLQIAHKSCNRFKRQNRDSVVQPYLRLRRELRDLQAECLFDGWQGLPSVNIQPKPVKLMAGSSEVEADFGATYGVKKSPVYQEAVGQKTCSFFFMEVPMEYIQHDSSCQPRTIKEGQVWKVYKDLHVNPLHEPPACRIEPDRRGKTRFLLFDGQHKTVSCHLHGRKLLVIKVYMDLSVEETKELVISIQATVSKLPLSALETMFKMGAVWVDKFQVYEKNVGGNASEQGFIEHLSAGDRAAAKKKLKEALLSEVYDQCHELKGLVESGEITETQAKTKIIDPLVYSKPLEEPLSGNGKRIRDDERSQVAWLVNEMAKKLFATASANASEKELIGVKRRRYGASLHQISSLMREVAVHLKTLGVSEPTLGHKKWTPGNKKTLKQAVDRVKKHGIWVHPSNAANVIAFEDAASKNQEMQKAFSNIGLKVGYANGSDKLDPKWPG